MQKNPKLPLILIIGVFLIALDFWYFKVYKKEEIPEEPPIIEPNPQVNEGPEYYSCGQDYTCEKIDGVEYKWTNKKVIKVKDVYNYDKDELEAGTIEITNDGKVVFYDLKREILKTFDSIKGKAIVMEESIDLCDENPVYIVLTEEGKLYMSDAHGGLMVGEAFTEIESEEVFTHFYTKVNNEYTCIVTEIYAKNKSGTISKLFTNENVTIQ